MNKKDNEKGIQNDGLNHDEIPELYLKKNFLGKWSAFFIERYRVTFLFIAIVLIWGVYQYATIKREAQPEVILPMAFVSTVYIGASPEEVETLITDKIENKLEDLDDINNLTSVSGFGYSSVAIEFDPGADIDEKLRDIREKLSNISSELPKDAELPVASDFEIGKSPVVIYTVSGDEDLMTLQNIANNVKKELEKISIVSEVLVIGDIEREITITVDPQTLQVYGITMEDIQNALTSSNINMPGGDIELNDKLYSIRTVGRFDQIDELQNVIIKSTDTGQLVLNDIAIIEDGYKEQEIFVSKSFYSSDDIKETKHAIGIAVKKRDSSDDIKVRNKVREVMEEKRSELIPENVQFDLVGDKAEYIEDIVDDVTDNAKAGFFLVIVVLFLFIGFGESLIVSFVIPLSLFAAFGLMKITGMTINNVTMFSMILAVGMLVDNAIVIMENVDRLRFKGLSAKDAAVVGTNQIAPAILASTLTTLAAFFPIALTSGIMGDFIKHIPFTVIFALSASFLMAITVTPSICSLALKKHRSHDDGKTHPIKKKIRISLSVLLVFILSLAAFMDYGKEGLKGIGPLAIVAAILFGSGMLFKQLKSKNSHEPGKIIKKYISFLEWILEKTRRKLLVIASVVIALIICIGTIPMGILKVEMFPSTDSPWLFVYVRTPEGTTVEDTDKSVKEIEKRLFSVPEIKSFVTYVGNNGANVWEDYNDDGGGIPNRSFLLLDLLEEEDRERSSMEIAQEIRTLMKGIPGIDFDVVEMEGGPPTGAPVFIRIKGNSLENIRKVEEDFANTLNGINGIRDVETSTKRGKNILEVKVDKEKAKRFGLDDITIAFGIRNSIHGITATTFRQDQEEIDIVIKLAGHKVNTIYDLEKLNFYNQSGDVIAFSQVASIVETESITAIQHEDGKRIVSVSADIVPNQNPEIETATDAVNAFKTAIKDYPVSDDVTIEYGGEMEMMGDSFGDMMVNMVIAVLLVFIILAIQFNSLSQPFIILLTLPMALIGVIPGLLMTGNAFGFFSFVGVVALVGIAVNDAIVLVDYINYLRKNGYDIKDAILETGKTRFIPVFATTITTVGGILPITLKDPFLAPMGIALMFGLTMATTLTLVIIPTIYSILEESKLKSTAKREAKLDSLVVIN
ncbi:MAG: hypothetical protein CVU84_04985 [Firmicutes bacterium HGW-Firmicutes-1]|jgi:HAE1 family hydrophobic/amphiphilic exporter-1|nr:MAG: hypothetical protein CVU84_04985 [Firmicutes bacterium HGW-Firmicutes-1]